MKKSEIIARVREIGLEVFSSRFPLQTIAGDSDWKMNAAVFSIEDYRRKTGLQPISFSVSESYSPSSEHDCSGEISGISIQVVNNQNGFVTIFLKLNFDY